MDQHRDQLKDQWTDQLGRQKEGTTDQLEDKQKVEQPNQQMECRMDRWTNFHLSPLLINSFVSV
jgi:hypothetical protein